jgi:endothelin-converting enzyme/putative endopeptidase
MRPVSLLSLLALSACPAPNPPPISAEADPDPITASMASAMNPEADACEDFYEYACGGWLASTEIPADRSRWVRSFSVISESNLAAQREILEGAADATDPLLGKIGDFYEACMAAEAPTASTLESLATTRELTRAWTTREELSANLGKLSMIGVDAFFSGSVWADYANPDLNILHVGQGGIALPDRDYYLREDEEGQALLAAYRSHVAAMLTLAGMPGDEAGPRADAIVDLEIEIAKISFPRDELRDVDETYHKVDRAGWQALWSFPLDPMFGALGVPEAQDVNVQKPEYFQRLDGVLAATSDDVIRDYLWWHVLHGLAPHLGAAFDQETFAFFGQRLTGQPEQSPRWKRCVGWTDEHLGEALGQAFVERHFAGESKPIAQELVRRVEASFEASLPELEWMDDATRERAVAKARAIINKIGYPDAWLDYGPYEVRANDHLGNVVRGRKFNVDRYVRRIGQPVDKAEWFMSPPTVNAYYNPSVNEIVFPAGILQPPFFSAEYPAAFNYGAIGMVIGHEITHGFDDEGRKFGPSGAYEEWWAPEVSGRFEERAQCLDDEYDGYELREGLAVNGTLTLGENIADHGGLKSAYGAYRGWVAENGEEAERAGLSGDQQFFVAFAQGWCSLARPEIEEMFITVDSHSPPRFRVNGPVSHSPEFARAFGCEAGDPMVAEPRCEVW